jgi:transposase
MVLFPTRLDEVIPAEHPVRLLDEILGRLDWSVWEVHYNLQCGQPPLHPRVMAGALLYGLLKRVRSSRALEEALKNRFDFHWLVEGRTIDHTTLSEFRRQHGEALKDLFVQVGMVARKLNLLPLEQLAYDGTRMRASNRRSGTRTPEELRESRQELQKKYAELEQHLKDRDARDDAMAAASSPAGLPQELASVKQRMDRIDAAVAELERAAEAGETLPRRIPLTDPEARVMPNKEGGFAPNYTPVITVDTRHGFIVACEVTSLTNEDSLLVPQIQEVQKDFGLDQPPPESLADGLMNTGANLQALDELGVTLYSPSKLADPATGPASRTDLTQPVPPELWDQLPMVETKPAKGEKFSQLAKDAFIYDAEQDCYYCPQGKALRLSSTTQEKIKGGTQERRRYKSDPQECAGCPLLSRCLKPEGEQREVSRYEHDHLQEELAARMSTPEGRKKYDLRRQVAERPFAMIKQHYGMRQFLLRGLENVRQEFRWMATALNVGRLISLVQSRAGPLAGLGAPSPSAATPG